MRHTACLTMADGLERTAWDHAKGNVSKLRILAWASNPIYAVNPKQIMSLATKSYLQLSTSDMAALREIGVGIALP